LLAVMANCRLLDAKWAISTATATSNSHETVLSELTSNGPESWVLRTVAVPYIEDTSRHATAWMKWWGRDCAPASHIRSLSGVNSS
jgi:hypothetical protein